MKSVRHILLAIAVGLSLAGCARGGPSSEALLDDAREGLASHEYARALLAASELLEAGADGPEMASASIVLAKIHFMAGNIEAAEVFAADALRHDPDNAEARLMLSPGYAGSVIVDRSAAMELYNDLYEHERSRALQMRRRYRLYVGAGVASVLLLSAILGWVLYTRRRQRRHILDLRRRLALIDSELREVHDTARSQISRLFRDSFESIESTANILIDSRLSKSKADAVVRQLELSVMEYRSPRFMEKLAKVLNSVHDGAIDMMKRDLAPLNDMEMTVALYAATGLSARVLCLLLDCTPASLYNRKYRLRRRILSADIPDDRRHRYITIIFGPES